MSVAVGGAASGEIAVDGRFFIEYASIMNAPLGSSSWMCGVLLLASSALAQGEAPSVRRLAWQEAVRLTQTEAADSGMTATNQVEKIAVQPPSERADDAVQVMDPVVVTRKRPPEIKVPRETSVEEFFRTGTVAEHVGSKVTSRLWMKGDKGVMWSLSW